MKEGKQEREKEAEPREGASVTGKKKVKPGQAPSEEEVLSAEALEDLRTRAAERDELLESVKRARADLINYQKRVEREKEALRKFALQEFLAELLAVVDDLQRAIKAARNRPDVKVLLQGMEMLEAKLGKLLQQSGVKAIETVGRPFDPGYHEAVVQEETGDYPDLTVLEELQKGYMIHERVLRPARVKVSRRKQPQEAELPADSKEEESPREARQPGGAGGSAEEEGNQEEG